MVPGSMAEMSCSGELSTDKCVRREETTTQLTAQKVHTFSFVQAVQEKARRCLSVQVIHHMTWVQLFSTLFHCVQPERVQVHRCVSENKGLC